MSKKSSNCFLYSKLKQTKLETNERIIEITFHYEFSIEETSSALNVSIVLLLQPSMIKAAGYPLQIHHVTTEDGYILELHRIPNGRYLRDETVVEEGKLCGPPAVFMHHGLTSSSADFIMNDGRKALGEAKMAIWIVYIILDYI